MLQRFRSVFGTVVYYGSDEHEWAFLSGCQDPVLDHVTLLTERLAELPYRPFTLDAADLRTRTTPPHALRPPAVTSRRRGS